MDAVDQKSFVAKLTDKIDICKTRMKPYLSHRQLLIRQYTGPYYWLDSEGGGVPSGTRNVLPGFFAYLNAVIPYLATHNPASTVTPKKRDLRFFAPVFKMAIDHTFEEIDFVVTLRRLMMDAAFGFALVKQGVNDPSDSPRGDAPEGFLHDEGQPFIDRVAPGKFVFDTNATYWEAAFFIGDRFQKPIADCRKLVESGAWDRKAFEAVENYETPDDGRSRSPEANRDRLDPVLDLVQIWLPRENKLMIIPDCQAGKPVVLWEEDYTGPERGPYEKFGFHQVPDEFLEIAPLSFLKDMDELNNKIGRKIYNRGDSDKEGMLYEGLEPAAIEAIRTSPDEFHHNLPAGSITGGKVMPFKVGGVSEATLRVSEWLQQQLNAHGANYQTLGGTRASSKTATQDQQLLKQAGGTINDMQQQAHLFVKQIVKKLAWYMVHASKTPIPLTQTIAGQMHDTPFDPREFEGDLIDYSLDLDVYSAAAKDPQRLYEDTMNLVERFIVPTLPVAMQQGDAPHIRSMAIELAKNLEIDIESIYRTMPVAQENPAQAGPAIGGDETTVNMGTPKPQMQAQPQPMEAGV